MRARRRRRHAGGEGHGAGPADRRRVPERGPRVRGVVLPEGHRRPDPDRGHAGLRLPAPSGPWSRSTASGSQRLLALIRKVLDPLDGPRRRRAGPGLQAQDGRHARGAERRADHAPRRGREPGAGVRPGRHGERPAGAAGERPVLPVLLRGRRGRRRRGDRDGVERVQALEPRAAASGDAEARSSSTGATSTSPSACGAWGSSTTRSAGSRSSPPEPHPCACW